MIQIVADPDELGQLYQRCVRCMYLRYRLNKDVGKFVGSDWAPSIVGYQTSDVWIELPKTERFRFRSYGEISESRDLPFPDAGVTLSFAGRYNALLDLERGGAIAVAKCLELENESAPKLYQWGLGGHAFSLQYPRTARVEPIVVSRLAVLEFKLTPAPGGLKNVVVPKRLTLMDRTNDRFLKWVGIVARLLGQRQPPRDACPVCKGL